MESPIALPAVPSTASLTTSSTIAAVPAASNPDTASAASPGAGDEDKRASSAAAAADSCAACRSRHRRRSASACLRCSGSVVPSVNSSYTLGGQRDGSTTVRGQTRQTPARQLLNSVLSACASHA